MLRASGRGTRVSENLCNIHNRVRMFNWSRFIWTMGVLLPVVIVAFDFLLFARVIPEQVIREYIVLNYETPNVFSMYLSNFAHLNLAHMFENMMSFMITMFFIVVTARIAVPAFNRRTPGMDCKFGTKTLLWSTVVFLTVVPFLISAESIVTGLSLGKTGGMGFSGVVFAFEGYLVYIVELLIIRKVQVVFEKRDKILAYSGMVLAAMIPMTVVGGQIAMMATSSVSANYLAHMLGFLTGIITPAAIDWYWRDREKYAKKQIVE